MFLWLATIVGESGAVGILGQRFANFNIALFGYVAYVYLLFLLYPAYCLYKDPRLNFHKIELFVAALLCFVSLLLFQSLLFSCGLFGNSVVFFLSGFIGDFGVWILGVGCLLLSIFVATDMKVELVVAFCKKQILAFSKKFYALMRAFGARIFAFARVCLQSLKNAYIAIKARILSSYHKRQEILKAAQEEMLKKEQERLAHLQEVQNLHLDNFENVFAKTQSTPTTHSAPMPNDFQNLNLQNVNLQNADSQNISQPQQVAQTAQVTNQEEIFATQAPLQTQSIESQSATQDMPQNAGQNVAQSTSTIPQNIILPQGATSPQSIAPFQNPASFQSTAPFIEVVPNPVPDPQAFLQEQIRNFQAMHPQANAQPPLSPNQAPNAPIIEEIILPQSDGQKEAQTSAQNTFSAQTSAFTQNTQTPSAPTPPLNATQLSAQFSIPSSPYKPPHLQERKNTPLDIQSIIKEIPDIPTPKITTPAPSAPTSNVPLSAQTPQPNAQSAFVDSQNLQNLTPTQSPQNPAQTMQPVQPQPTQSTQTTPTPPNLPNENSQHITESSTPNISNVPNVPTAPTTPNAPTTPEVEFKAESEAQPQPESSASKTHVIVRELSENTALLKSLDFGKSSTPLNFKLPLTSLLNQPDGFRNEIDEVEIDTKSEILLAKLKTFKIEGDVVRTYSGPIVTTFEFRPAPNVKVSRILNLEDDLALALSAKSIRIQAPVPGKDVVGIEIPNNKTETIYLREVLESDLFKSTQSSLTLAFGKDIVGNPFVQDLRKLPHLLIAGTTGSGKSVGINAMILSLLYKNSPDNLKLMMIDPKRVEFSLYNDIPHLITPIITDPKKAIAGLVSAMQEMDRRYEKMKDMRVKEIESYNKKALEEGEEQLKYFVIIIDELADLMQTSGREAEAPLSRIAQMGRACGIHLIIATQRPSVDVVTGTLKGNLPSRISYKVGSKVDSKVILDSTGAESLLGKGDMLFKISDTMIRLHAPFSTEEEIERVVEFIKSQREVQYDANFLLDEKENILASRSENEPEDDDMLEQIKRFMLESGNTSSSSVQRRFSIGFNRATNYVETLEKEGFLSKRNTKGVREIIGR
ncbi:DNA translocase FtsK 4TM domain-containing protein [Helicobacter sp. MIT 00-7814]|uniref:DNA translocase FtsK 4TM domain-containing protein n=1 Tax=unclassified Helicobacter TaxID=2593540 RepID=UPI0038CF73CF